MEVSVNGENTQLPEGAVLAHLLEQMELLGKRIAVELNMEIVPRSLHGETVLQAGDRVEIVHAIGGG
ncbi:thiamine biosynthesis protein ThiS [Pokkaliibacter plantistimulans]|uniref:Thiamine biosynthesis protein ThiS n=2 Tax=Pseudomonadota TaxID=1224 RepID=A0ABX5M633_9GAMM|nr:sulfur carrier protein ThiS [Pokkaliibacter plantistimulans]PPC74483.1 sulfur carrier protein ThiS [Pokkaliibacter plantistimulans]PXF33138.1 thiamine biosynthesis protein ThiS [Pokkaliibacter plantistimulans]